MLNIETEKINLQLATVIDKIENLQRLQSGGYTANVAKSFHLGMVGGSGRNIANLNRKRANELDKTIDRAVILTKLYCERDALKWQIDFIESGKRDAKIQREKTREEKRAEYWQNLKAGDILDLGNSNGNPIIKKKSLKSVTTISGTKWTAIEIIGKTAAALL